MKILSDSEFARISAESSTVSSPSPPNLNYPKWFSGLKWLSSKKASPLNHLLWPLLMTPQRTSCASPLELDISTNRQEGIADGQMYEDIHRTVLVANLNGVNRVGKFRWSSHKEVGVREQRVGHCQYVPSVSMAWRNPEDLSSSVYLYSFPMLLEWRTTLTPSSFSLGSCLRKR